MSPAYFHICVDQQQVAQWWRTPMSRTVTELATWRLNGRATHWGSLDDTNVSVDLVEPVRLFQTKYGEHTSLSSACQEAIYALGNAQSHSFVDRLRTLM